MANTRITFFKKLGIFGLLLFVSFGLINCGGGGESSSGGGQTMTDASLGQVGEGGDGNNEGDDSGGEADGGGVGGTCAIKDKVTIICQDSSFVVTIGNGICEGFNSVESERNLLFVDEYKSDGEFDCSNEENGICGDPHYTDKGKTDPDCKEYDPGAGDDGTDGGGGSPG